MSFFHDRYDCIIVGASLAGLTSAIEMQMKGRNVLVLEQGSAPGGMARSFVMGQFEFDAILHQLSGIGSPDNPSYLREYFDKLGVEIEWVKTNETFKFILPKYEFVVPTGIQNLANVIDEEFPGSMEKIIKLMNICQQIHECMCSLYEDTDVKSAVLRKHPEFSKYANSTLLEVLVSLDLEDKAIEILSANWLFWGLPVNELSFIPWANVMWDTINKGIYVPKLGSYGIARALEKRARQLGAQIEYKCEVDKILVDGDGVRGVSIDGGETIRCEYVISGIIQSIVYSKMIEPLGAVPEKALKISNSKEIGASAFSVYIALDTSPDKLNIKTYNTIIGKTTDPNAIYNNYHSLDPYEYMSVVCRGVINPESAPKGSSAIVISAFPNAKQWGKVDMSDYITTKRKIAKGMIERVNNALDINLFDHIIEISIATPVTIAQYTKAMQGNVFGYAPNTLDTLLMRLHKQEEEKFIHGLYFAGAHGLFGGGVPATIINGYLAAKGVHDEMRSRGRK